MYIRHVGLYVGMRTLHEPYYCPVYVWVYK